MVTKIYKTSLQRREITKRSSKKLKQKRKELGLCLACGTPKEPTPGCTVCRSRQNTDKAKLYRQERNLRKNFGLTLIQYNSLHTLQQGLCTICHRPQIGGKSLSVDHNHVTGKVRGLLCSRCNTALGSSQDSIITLKDAITYLEFHT